MNTELNIEVAEKVMGWKRCGDDDHTRPLHTSERRKREGYPEEVVPVDDYGSKGPHPRLVSPDGERVFFFCSCEDSHYDTLPDFSGDIADAWKVVDAITVPLEIVRLKSGRWQASRWENHNGDAGDVRTYSLAEEDTFPEAICRAALAAVQSGQVVK